MPESILKGTGDEYVLVLASDNWRGLYVDGHLAVEGANLSVNDIFCALGLRLRIALEDVSQSERGGSLPMHLSGVILAEATRCIQN